MTLPGTRFVAARIEMMVLRNTSPQQAQCRDHLSEYRKCLCEHRAGETPRHASLQAGKLGA